MNFNRLDEFALALMASAPIARCACPNAPDQDCQAHRCAACYEAMWAVIEWGHANVFDSNGQWLSRQYLRRAFTHDIVRWNIVRRGLMIPFPVVEAPPAIAIQVRVERADLVCTSCFEVVVPDAQEHLPCMHAFHRGCIGTWLRMQRTCPVCRAEF
jgi:hypothetical protein